mmetsp:Transcript_6118/g.17530  ORF Transcript_6118/g.17530 Transcript_6118/m.17530 type:complete len:1094 (+) Transcript_6118:147-3428(+)
MQTGNFMSNQSVSTALSAARSSPSMLRQSFLSHLRLPAHGCVPACGAPASLFASGPQWRNQQQSRALAELQGCRHMLTTPCAAAHSHGGAAVQQRTAAEQVESSPQQASGSSASWQTQGASASFDTSHLDALSDEQLAAATAPLDRHCRVEAGPGSGKTRVLMARVAHLLTAGGVPPHKVMTITFTNRAADELKERLKTQVGTAIAAKLTTGTFHSVAMRMLRVHVHRLPHCGRDRNFNIHDQEDNVNLLMTWVRKRRDNRAGVAVATAAAELRKAAKQMLSYISNFKSSVSTAYGFKPQELVETVLSQDNLVPGLRNLVGNAQDTREVVECMEWFEKQLRDSNVMDFDDLLSLGNAVLRDPEVAERYSSRFHHLLVDEFQDTSAAQYDFVTALTRSGAKLFVVGDPNQSIYRFRGSDPQKMQEQFMLDFPEAPTLDLRDNYRSTPEILGVAMSALALQAPLRPLNDNGHPVLAVSSPSGYTEASYIVNKLRDLERQGHEWSEMAVLFRTHALTRLVEDALVKAGIPFKMLGGTPFWGRTEVKDVMAYMRLISSLADVTALKRIINKPARRIGEMATKSLQAWAESQDMTAAEALFQGCHNCSADKLPPLPAAEEMGMSVANRKLLSSFRLGICECRDVARTQSVPDLLDHVLRWTGYEQYVKDGKAGSGKGKDTLDGFQSDEDFRWSNVLQIRTCAEDWVASLRDPSMDMEDPSLELEPQVSGPGLDSLAEFVQEVALLSGDSLSEDGSPAVRLVTMHAAKGLEFQVVFIAGMEEGQMPHFYSRDSAEDLEEERRLLFVAITRAKQRLFLTHARTRVQFGQVEEQDRSRFMAAMAPEAAVRAGPSDTVGNSGRTSFQAGAYGRWSDGNGDEETYEVVCEASSTDDGLVDDHIQPRARGAREVAQRRVFASAPASSRQGIVRSLKAGGVFEDSLENHRQPRAPRSDYVPPQLFGEAGASRSKAKSAVRRSRQGSHGRDVAPKTAPSPREEPVVHRSTARRSTRTSSRQSSVQQYPPKFEQDDAADTRERRRSHRASPGREADSDDLFRSNPPLSNRVRNSRPVQPNVEGDGSSTDSFSWLERQVNQKQRRRRP